MNRRTFIHTSLATTSAAVLAGCTNLRDNGNNPTDNEDRWADLEPPEYANWIPQSDSDSIFFTHIDFDAMEDIDEAGDRWGADFNSGGSEDTPQYQDQLGIAGIPLSGALVAMIGGTFGLISYPFGQDIYPGSDGETAEGLGTESLTFTNNSIVFLGEFDTTVFENDYTTREGFDGEEITLFEKVEERDGFDIYVEPEDGGTAWAPDQTLAYAVSDSAVIVPTPADSTASNETSNREQVETVLDLNTGGGSRIIDVDDGNFLLGHLADADMVTGFWNMDKMETEDEQSDNSTDDGGTGSDGIDTSPKRPQFESAAIADATHLASGLTFKSKDELTVDFAAVYPDSTRPSEADLEAAGLFKSNSSNAQYGQPEIVVDGARATLSVSLTNQSEENTGPEDESNTEN